MDVSRETIGKQFTRALRELFQANSLPLTERQERQMCSYYHSLAEENKKQNLTAITDAREAAEKHFLDSVLPYAELPEGAAVVDIGSGAGFPIVPLAILRPDIHAAALEASQKKCRFIETATHKAGVGISIINGRAEELAHGELRETFDVCVSRAVARLNVLLELCLPYVRPGGLFLAYKGNYREELAQAENALKMLGAEFEKTLDYPHTERDCTVLAIRKTAPTDEKYPRKNKQITKRPL